MYFIVIVIFVILLIMMSAGSEYSVDQDIFTIFNNSLSKNNID